MKSKDIIKLAVSMGVCKPSKTIPLLFNLPFISN